MIPPKGYSALSSYGRYTRSSRFSQDEPVSTYGAPNSVAEATPHDDIKTETPLSTILEAESVDMRRSTAFGSLADTSAHTQSINTRSDSSTSPKTLAKAQQNAPPPSSHGDGGISKGINIGVIIGVVIVVILTLIAIGFCFLDGRRRVKRYREKRQAKQDAEANMLQDELRRGRSGRNRRESIKPPGLWDGLRKSVDMARAPVEPERALVQPDMAEVEERPRRSVSFAEPGVAVAERRRSSVRFAEPVVINESQDAMGVADGNGEAIERRLSEVRRERASIVSSTGSTGMPTFPPVVAMSLFDREVR
jgi:hypothetical protein